MYQSPATLWRGVVLSAVVAVAAGMGVNAHAERVITTSDTGNGGGLGGPGVGRLFSCRINNLTFDPDVPFSCQGAVDHAYDAGNDFSIVEGLVNGRFANWTSTDKSATVDHFNGKLFFNTELHGNFAFVLSGGWMDNSTPSAPKPSFWSAYYVLEDVGILPQTTNHPLGIRLNLDIVDVDSSGNTTYLNTNYLSIDRVSVYQISAVPEPQSLALVGLGLAGLLLAGHGVRRRRASGSVL